MAEQEQGGLDEKEGVIKAGSVSPVRSTMLLDGSIGDKKRNAFVMSSLKDSAANSAEPRPLVVKPTCFACSKGMKCSLHKVQTSHMMRMKLEKLFKGHENCKGNEA